MGFQQGFRINTNTASLDTYRAYSKSQAGLETNIERLSSGLRINNAGDDTAGSAISNRMDNQVRGMQQANRNVQQGNNMLQTAEGGLDEISNILGRMRELAVQSASDGMNTDDRSSIDLEFQQLKAEITRIADGTEYNGKKLLNEELTTKGQGNYTASGFTLTGDSIQAGAYSVAIGDSSNELTITTSDGRSQTVAFTEANGSATQSMAAGGSASFGSLGITISNDSTSAAAALTGATQASFNITGGVTIQVGANNVALEDRLQFAIGDHTADSTSGGLGISTVSLDSLANAQGAIDDLDAAIAKVNDSRGNIGAMQNRFEYASSNLMNSVQNNSASMSTIRDADFAAEAADLAKNQILVQSGTAMLAQANGLSQNVLALIR
ncbi:MAG: flagellin [Gammaproteobacteria bacterium]|nr:flagellin [Gammaproteobacteria bacterium]